jgi:hypothetical protein
MTERNFTYELAYSNYIDMENGDDTESIDYRSLIHIMTEMMNRIEKLEVEVKVLNRKLTDDTFEVIKND